MIRHIVMWSLHDADRAAEVKTVLETMRGRIPGLLSLEVGIDILHSPQSADVVLTATLADREALHSYQAHPAHQPAIALMKELACARTVIDYEV